MQNGKLFAALTRHDISGICNGNQRVEIWKRLFSFINIDFAVNCERDLIVGTRGRKFPNQKLPFIYFPFLSTHSVWIWLNEHSKLCIHGGQGWRRIGRNEQEEDVCLTHEKCGKHQIMKIKLERDLLFDANCVFLVPVDIWIKAFPFSVPVFKRRLSAGIKYSQISRLM